MKYIYLLFLLIFTLSFGQKIETIKFNDSSISIEELLQKYIQIPSVSGQEKEAGDFIKSVCEQNGLIITEFGSEDGMYNFAASLYPLTERKPNIVLLNHIDVVPEESDSKYGAYSGKIVDDKVYGRGAIDNKGAAVMQLFSLLQFQKTKHNKNNVTFLSVSCEETQCEGGVKYVIDNYLDLLNPAVVIGEGPSELTTLIGGEFKYPVFGVSLAHKRSFWLKLELEIQTSGHGSITPLKYANKEMIASLNRLAKKKNKAIFNDLNKSFLKALADHKKGIEKLVLKNPEFLKVFLIPQLRKQPELFALFSNTITITNIYTDSETYNSIPSNIGAYLDCRLLPMTEETDFLKELKSRLRNDSIKITITENMPKTVPSSTKSKYFRNLEKAIIEKYPGSKVMPVMLPNINDLGAFRNKGVPAYSSIPVYFTKDQIMSIHNKDENIPIIALYDGAEVYLKFLELLENE